VPSSWPSKLKLSKRREFLATHCRMPEDLSLSLLYLYCNFYDLAKVRPLNLYFHCAPEVSHTNTDMSSPLTGFKLELKKNFRYPNMLYPYFTFLTNVFHLFHSYSYYKSLCVLY
jgi:hypothetical protein